MLIKSVKEYASDVNLLNRKEEKNLRKKVEHFIDNDLRRAIEASIKSHLKSLIDNPNKKKTIYAAAKVPGDYYSHKEYYLKVCDEILKPLGYTKIYETDDGAGMYALIGVEFEIK